MEVNFEKLTKMVKTIVPEYAAFSRKILTSTIESNLPLRAKCVAKKKLFKPKEIVLTKILLLFGMEDAVLGT